MAEYQEPVDRVIACLKAIKGPFKMVYDGDPDQIPDFNLPCLCVVQLNDTNNQGAATGTDDVDVTIQIRVVFDKKADWSAQDDTVELTDRKIRQAVEARDAATNKYLSTSIKGALRTTLRLPDGAYLRQEMRFDLGTAVRPNDLVTREGTLQISISYILNRDLMLPNN